MHPFINDTISFLERASEPESWIPIVGPRIFSLLTRYMNNDVVVAGFLVYAYCKFTFFQYLLYVRLFDLRKTPPHPATFYEVFQTFYQVASVYIQDFFYATILIEHGDPIFG